MDTEMVTPEVDLAGRRLVVCSNREPYKVSLREDGYEFETTKGGLASALIPIMRSTGGLWISWGGGPEEEKHRLPDRQEVPGAEPQFTQRRVFLTAEQVDNFYYGFANQALWPLCHFFVGRCHFLPEHWNAYLRVNELYAGAIAQEADAAGDMVWVQDYHMGLVGKMLKRLRPGLASGIFWHIPFPPPEVFTFLPWKHEILEGLLGNDVVAFHTMGYCENFGRCASLFLGAEWDAENMTVRYEGRMVRLLPRGIGVNYDYFNKLGSSRESEEKSKEIKRLLGVEKLLLGVDRLDYTKGIPERLLALERFLERYPEYRGRLSLIQIAVPSRTHIAEYQRIIAEVNRQVGRINGRFSRGGWVPIHYYFYGFPQSELVAYYRAADVALVTPIQDGMNLIAKEFAASRADEYGVLVLSEHAGTAEEFPDLVSVNPFDIEETASAIKSALETDGSMAREIMRRMREEVRAHDLQWWIMENLGALGLGGRGGREPNATA
jgi:trehalose 6-phosphate synthase